MNILIEFYFSILSDTIYFNLHFEYPIFSLLQLTGRFWILNSIMLILYLSADG